MVISSGTIPSGILRNTDRKFSPKKYNKTEKEKEIVKRGRNVQNHHVAKNANVADYAMSTAFEALIGYLYLTKQDERLKEILELSWKLGNN